MFVLLSFICFLVFYYTSKQPRPLKAWLQLASQMRDCLLKGGYLNLKLKESWQVGAECEWLFAKCMLLQKQGRPVLGALTLLKDQCQLCDKRSQQRRRFLIVFFTHLTLVLAASSIVSIWLRSSASVSGLPSLLKLDIAAQVVAGFWIGGCLYLMFRKAEDDWFWQLRKGSPFAAKTWLDKVFDPRTQAHELVDLNHWAEMQNSRQQIQSDTWLENMGLIEFMVVGVPCLLILATPALMHLG